MAKRAAQGTGTIRQKTVVKNGKSYVFWEARATVGRDPGTGKQIQKSFTGKTQKEVREKMQAATVEVNKGTYHRPCKMTVAEWLDIWATTYLGSVKPRTVESYVGHIKNHIKPALGALKLDALTTHTIQQFYNSLSAPQGSKPGLAPKTIRCTHGVLHKALQQAAAVGYIHFNPAESCILPRAERREVHPLDNEAISAFLKAIQGHRFETLYHVTLFTGIRRGEVCGLTWDCVDLERGSILINKQLQNIQGQRGAYRFVSLKNDKSRSIRIPTTLVTLLKKHRVQQNKLKIEAGELWEDGNYVFTNEIGHHLSPHTVYHNYKRLVASIGLPNARFHDLRHSYAVAAIRSGDDIKTVQGNLGHATAAFTLDVYGHVTDEMKQASAARMEAFIKNVSGL